MKPIHEKTQDLLVRLEEGPSSIDVGIVRYALPTRTVAFEWSPQARQAKLDLSPVQIPLSGEVWTTPPGLPFEYGGLPGLLNDSLPDGWGLYLLDQALTRLHPPHPPSPLTRLAYLANRAWGALSFQPVVGERSEGWLDIQALAGDLEASIAGHIEDVSEALLRAGSSPHGARPKIMVDLSEDRKQARVSAGAPVPGATAWLIKFAGRDEPVDAPLLEDAYMRVAHRAGLVCMPSEVMEVGSRLGFATQRFDRMNGARQFVHSLGGLLHFSHRDPGLDYAHVAEAMRRLRMEPKAHVQAFRRAVFNAVMSVRDDHAKNFAFTRTRAGQWNLSPAYDLVYSLGPGGYHTLTFAGSTDRDPSTEALMALAAAHDVAPALAREILNQVVEASKSLKDEAKGLGVRSATLAPVVARLDAIGRGIRPAGVVSSKLRKRRR